MNSGCSVVNDETARLGVGAFNEIHMNKHKPEHSGVHVAQTVASRKLIFPEQLQ
jgi:hypothetical protein